MLNKIQIYSYIQIFYVLIIFLLNKGKSQCLNRIPTTHFLYFFVIIVGFNHSIIDGVRWPNFSGVKLKRKSICSKQKGYASSIEHINETVNVDITLL